MSLGFYTDQEQISIQTATSQQIFSHSSWVVYSTVTKSKAYSLLSKALLDISWVLYWSETYFNAPGQWRTAFSHISWVTYWSRTDSNNIDSYETTLLHISSLLHWSGRFIQFSLFFIQFLGLVLILKTVSIFIDNLQNFTSNSFLVIFKKL